MKKILVLSLIVSSGFLWGFGPKTPAPNKLNIILILADDMGFSDIGCYGSEIRTPNLDKLASEGMRLKQCYTNAICAPSRATLLTGQYPHKAGVGFFNSDLGIPAYQGYLNRQSLTIAEVFQQAGYQTMLSGKWHHGLDSIKGPRARGFDQFFGFIGGAFSYFDTKPITKNNPFNFLVDDTKAFHPTVPDFYLTDEITRRGIGFLKQNENKKPFFLHLAYSSPHWPLHAKPQDIARYKGHYDIGWDSLRTLRHQKQVQLGLVSQNQGINKDKSLPLWNSMTYDERQYWTKKMEVYAAMVDNLDQNIGQLIAYLKASGQLDNTLIVFVSDNGAEGWDFTKLPMAAIRNTGPVGTAGSNESYTKNWSQVSNVPFKSYKATPYEGGLSSPFIARLPKTIPANTLHEGVVHFVDFMPTLLEIAEIAYPRTNHNEPVNPLPGESFARLLRGENWSRKTPIFYEWAGHRMVRRGNWKLLSFYPENQWELYDMATDRTETTNIATANPDIVKQLNDAYLAWAKQNDVVEWNEGFAKKTTFPTENR